MKNLKYFFTKKEYQAITDKFGLGVIRHIAHFRRGYQTPRVAITTPEGKFVIAKHNLSIERAVVADMKILPRTALLHEITLLNWLHSLPVPHYLQSKRRRYLENFQGWTVSVYQYLPGSQPKKITLPMAHQLGVFMGRFHALGAKYKTAPRGRRRFYDLNPRVMTRMYRYAKKQTHPALKNVVEEVKSGVENNRLPGGLPQGPIHVDIKPENELFIGQKLTGVVDFGNFYVDAFVFDIGKTIMWNCIKADRLDKALINQFLKGYGTQRKLSQTERHLMHRAILFAIYSHVWVDLYHVPINYVPQRYTLFLVNKFLPIARRLENQVGKPGAV